jgi:molybdopterin-binding protein
MNIIKGRVEKLHFDHELSHIEISSPIGTIHSVVLEDITNKAGFLKEGTLVACFFSETSPMITKEPITCINTFEGVVKGFDMGKVLCRVHLEVKQVPLRVLLLREQAQIMEMFPNKKVFLFLPPWYMALEVAYE